MTNEQLAVLLNSINKQLTEIYANIAEEIRSVVECHTVKRRGKWIGDGEKPSEFSVYWIFGGRDKDWEWTKEKGDPICLDALADFLDYLHDSAYDLNTRSDKEE